MPTLPDDLMRAPTARMLNEHGRRIEGLLLPEQRRPLSYRGRGG